MIKLGEDKISYADYVATIEEIMNQKEEDAGLQRMYDLLLFNPTLQAIDFDTLKQIAEETGHHMTDSEIKFALKEAGDGKTIPIDAFIKFMKCPGPVTFTMGPKESILMRTSVSSSASYLSFTLYFLPSIFSASFSKCAK